MNCGTLCLRTWGTLDSWYLCPVNCISQASLSLNFGWFSLESVRIDEQRGWGKREAGILVPWFFPAFCGWMDYFEFGDKWSFFSQPGVKCGKLCYFYWAISHFHGAFGSLVTVPVIHPSNEQGWACFLNWSVGIDEDAGAHWSPGACVSSEQILLWAGTLHTPVALPPCWARALGTARSSQATFYWKGGTLNKPWKPQNWSKLTEQEKHFFCLKRKSCKREREKRWNLRVKIQTWRSIAWEPPERHRGLASDTLPWLLTAHLGAWHCDSQVQDLLGQHSWYQQLMGILGSASVHRAHQSSLRAAWIHSPLPGHAHSLVSLRNLCPGAIWFPKQDVHLLASMNRTFMTTDR